MKAFMVTSFMIMISAILQTTWFTGLNLRPDGIVAITLAISFLRGPECGALSGFCGGLIQDGLSGGSHGAFCLVGLVVGWLPGFFFKGVYSENLLILFLGMILGSFLHFALLREWAFLLGSLSDSFFPPSFLVWLLVQGTLGLVLLLSCRKWLFPPAIKV